MKMFSLIKLFSRAKSGSMIKVFSHVKSRSRLKFLTKILTKKFGIILGTLLAIAIFLFPYIGRYGFEVFRFILMMLEIWFRSLLEQGIPPKRLP